MCFEMYFEMCFGIFLGWIWDGFEDILGILGWI